MRYDGQLKRFDITISAAPAEVLIFAGAPDPQKMREGMIIREQLNILIGKVFMKSLLDGPVNSASNSNGESPVIYTGTVESS